MYISATFFTNAFATQNILKSKKYIGTPKTNDDVIAYDEYESSDDGSENALAKPAQAAVTKSTDVKRRRAMMQQMIHNQNQRNDYSEQPIPIQIDKNEHEKLSESEADDNETKSLKKKEVKRVYVKKKNRKKKRNPKKIKTFKLTQDKLDEHNMKRLSVKGRAKVRKEHDYQDDSDTESESLSGPISALSGGVVRKDDREGDSDESESSSSPSQNESDGYKSYTYTDVQKELEPESVGMNKANDDKAKAATKAQKSGCCVVL